MKTVDQINAYKEFSKGFQLFCDEAFREFASYIKDKKHNLKDGSFKERRLLFEKKSDKEEFKLLMSFYAVPSDETFTKDRIEFLLTTNENLNLVGYSNIDEPEEQSLGRWFCLKDDFLNDTKLALKEAREFYTIMEAGSIAIAIQKVVKKFIDYHFPNNQWPIY